MASEIDSGSGCSPNEEVGYSSESPRSVISTPICRHKPQRQGLTAERVLIHANTSVHPDLLSSRFGYVAVSRASHEATIFTDDVNRLAQQLGTEVSKTSALEIRHTESISQSLGF